MKQVIRNLSMMLFALFVTTYGFTQEHRPAGVKDQKKMEQVYRGHVLKALELDDQQAQVFWTAYEPIIQEHRALLKQRKESKQYLKDQDITSEDAAQSIVNNDIVHGAKMLDLKKRKVAELAPIIGYVKLVKLNKVERKFAKRVLKERKKRRDKRGKKQKNKNR